MRDFFHAKVQEQQQRHDRFHDTAYNLEPNIKESPGGLRDLQTVLWLARAAGLGRSWGELARAGLITAAGGALGIARKSASSAGLRLRLHYLAGRREDRLVFDHQIEIARQLDLADTPTKRASDLLMQRYYRAAKPIRQANVILLQNLHARMVPLGGASRGRSTPTSAPSTTCWTSRDESLFERARQRCSTPSCRMQRHRGPEGHVGPHAARAVARRPRDRRGFRADPATAAASCRSCASRAASPDGCGA